MSGCRPCHRRGRGRGDEFRHTLQKREKTVSGMRLLVDDGEGFVGGAKERGGFVEDDGDGDVTEETLEFPFVLEGVEESAVFHCFQNFYSDAASDVSAVEGEHFEGEISGFGIIDGGPEIQGVGADAAGLVQAAACDFRGGIGVGIFKCGMHHFRRKEFVNGAEAAAGENELPTDLRVAAAHEAQEFDLLLGVRGEIGMAAFGGHDAVAATVPSKNRLAQTGAGRHQCANPARLRSARVQNTKVFLLKMLETVPPGAQVVQQNDVRDAEHVNEIGSLHNPRKIGGTHASIDNWASDTETGGNNALAIKMLSGLARTFLDDP